MRLRLLALTIAALFLAGCDYDAPLTPAPIHKIDARLLGDWVGVDPEAKQEEVMHVRALDDTTYVVAMDSDIYRAYHSDFAGTAFLTVQDLNADDRKYCFYTWALSADATRLTLRCVSTKVIPDQTKTTAGLQQLIQANLANPKLLEKEISFTRKARHF